MDNARNYIKMHYADIIFCAICISAFFAFINNIYDYGIFYDEVNRLNPMFAMFDSTAIHDTQATWSIKIGDHIIPMMYKEYISSLSTFYMLPLLLFKNPVIGLKTLYLIYFFIEIACLYLYLKRFNKNFAVGVCILFCINPLHYPDAFYGFSNSFHIVFIVSSLFQFEKYYLTRKKRKLFGAVFLLCLGANLSFYTVWNIVALATASLFIDFEVWKSILKDAKSIGVVFLAGVMGLFNFVLYNVLNGFPTIAKLLTYIFDTGEFQMDGVTNESLGESIRYTLSRLDYMLGGTLNIYIIILLLTTIFWTGLAALYIKKKFFINKHFFYPILATIITIFCILISPKPRFPYHWLRLSPAWEITLLLTFGIAAQYLRKKAKMIVYAAGFIWIAGLTFVSTEKINSNQSSALNDYISNDYQKITDYITKLNIDNSQILYFEWGIDAPIYFISRGKFNPAIRYYFDFMFYEQEQFEERLKEAFAMLAFQDMYVPLYKENDDVTLNQPLIYKEVLHFMEKYNLSYNKIADYFLEDINLYKVEKDADYFNKVYNLEISALHIDNLPSAPNSLKGHTENIEPLANSKTQNIRGWAFIPNMQISYLLPLNEENEIIGFIRYGISRPDVQNAFPTESALNSGFSGEYFNNEQVCSMLICTNDGFIYKWDGLYGNKE